MADISKITPPGSQTTYNLKDATAREQAAENKNNISTLQTSLAVGSSDNAKVLTAIYEGGEGSYAWVTPSGGGGTTDYTLLENKPQINSVTLTGNKSLSDLGIAAAADIPTVPITEIQRNSSTISPVSGVVNISVPTSAADVSALPASTKYAGASTAGGSATSAAKLDTTSAGSTTQPVYFANGVPTATTYSLAKSVPSDAVFTDTTYESKSAASGGTAVSLCTTGEKYTWNNKQSALTTAQLSAVNSGIDSTKVAQIETNKDNISKYQVKTLNVNFNDLTFTQSIEGMYYSNEIAISGLTMLLSVMITGFVDIKGTDVITPILSNDGSKLRFISNVSTFSTSARYSLQIFGINDA